MSAKKAAKKTANEDTGETRDEDRNVEPPKDSQEPPKEEPKVETKETSKELPRVWSMRRPGREALRRQIQQHNPKLGRDRLDQIRQAVEENRRVTVQKDGKVSVSSKPEWEAADDGSVNGSLFGQGLLERW